MLPVVGTDLLSFYHFTRQIGAVKSTLKLYKNWQLMSKMSQSGLTRLVDTCQGSRDLVTHAGRHVFPARPSHQCLWCKEKYEYSYCSIVTSSYWNEAVTVYCMCSELCCVWLNFQRYKSNLTKTKPCTKWIVPMLVVYIVECRSLQKRCVLMLVMQLLLIQHPVTLSALSCVNTPPV